MKKILVPLDFSDHSKTVFRFALEWAKKIKASITLFNAIHLPQTERGRIVEYKKTLENIRNTSLKKMDFLCKELADINFSDIQINKKVENIFPVEGILHSSTDLAADLIIMGLRNQSKWDDILFGSVANGVLKKVKIPILVIPPQYEYKAIEHILYLAHFGFSDIENLQLISEWSKN